MHRAGAYSLLTLLIGGTRVVVCRELRATSLVLRNTEG